MSLASVNDKNKLIDNKAILSFSVFLYVFRFCFGEEHFVCKIYIIFDSWNVVHLCCSILLASPLPCYTQNSIQKFKKAMIREKPAVRPGLGKSHYGNLFIIKHLSVGCQWMLTLCRVYALRGVHVYARALA